VVLGEPVPPVAEVLDSLSEIYCVPDGVAGIGTGADGHQVKYAEWDPVGAHPAEPE
jgi:hypothetical protein